MPSPRLAVPYILAAQSQKEVTHNDGLNVLDALVQAVVEDRDLTAPPGAPAEGQVWIVAAAATGDWAGHDGELAQFIGGAWKFHTPFEGLIAWLADEDVFARYDGAVWVAGVVAATQIDIGGQKVVGGQEAAIADASGGATVDAEARTAINAVLAALRNHGLIAT
ncbi:MAG: DUF2793 domain-containing protein [Sphingomonadales bacterium]|nr:DUF2793 domain-containing protein [Sphingomonadales bacterium]